MRPTYCGPRVSYEDAVATAKPLLEDVDAESPLNMEYARGVVELTADLFPDPATPYLADRKLAVVRDLGLPWQVGEAVA